MGAATKLVDKKALASLEPINRLETDKLDELASKSSVHQFTSGESIFQQGDDDKRMLFVLTGKVEIVDTLGARTTIKAGTPAARTPLSLQTPRTSTATAKGLTTLLCVDSDLLDLLLHWNDGGTYEITEIHADSGSDWIACLLKLPALQRLTPDKLQSLMARIEHITVSANEVVIKQGTRDGYFYIITQGNFRVSRKPSAHAKDILLAQLGPGESFGEEALIANGERNASITAIDKGELLRLSREDFYNLLQIPLLNYVNTDKALLLLEKGAVLLDVRNPEEFAKNGIGINIPISLLRLKAGSINKSLKYIICADNDKQSAIAAFLLIQLGMEVYILQEGVKALQGKKGGASSAKAGEIVNFSQAKHAFSSSANPTNPFADQSVPLANPPANESNNGAKQSSSKPDLEAEANLRNELNMAQALLDEEIKRAESFQQERQLLQNEIARLQQETSQVRQRAETDSVRTANEIQNTLSREISRLKKELADEINRRDSIEKNRSELEHNISALRKDLDNTRQHADLQAQRIAQIEQDAAMKRESIANVFQDQIATTETRLNDEIRRAETIDRARLQLEQDLSLLRQSLEQSNCVAEEQKAHIQRLEASAADSNNQVSSELQNRIASLQSQLVDYTKRAETAEQNTHLHQSEIGRLSQELAAAHQSAAQHLQRADALEQQSAHLKTQLQIDHQAKLEEAYVKLAEITQYAQASEAKGLLLEQEIASITQELHEARQVSEQHRQYIAQLEEKAALAADFGSKLTDESQRLATMEAARKELEQEIILVRAEAYDARKQSEKHTRRVSEVEAELARLKSEIETNLQTTIGELQSQLAAETKQRLESNDRKQALDQRIVDLQARLAEAAQQLAAAKDADHIESATLRTRIADLEQNLIIAAQRAGTAENGIRDLEIRLATSATSSPQIEAMKAKLESDLNTAFEMRLEREIATALSLQESEIRNRVTNDAEAKIKLAEEQVKTLRSAIRQLESELDKEISKRTLLEKSQGKVSLDNAQARIRNSRKLRGISFSMAIIMVIGAVYSYTSTTDLHPQARSAHEESTAATGTAKPVRPEDPARTRSTASSTSSRAADTNRSGGNTSSKAVIRDSGQDARQKPPTVSATASSTLHASTSVPGNAAIRNPAETKATAAESHKAPAILAEKTSVPGKKEVALNQIITAAPASITSEDTIQSTTADRQDSPAETPMVPQIIQAAEIVSDTGVAQQAATELSKETDTPAVATAAESIISPTEVDSQSNSNNAADVVETITQ